MLGLFMPRRGAALSRRKFVQPREGRWKRHSDDLFREHPRRLPRTFRTWRNRCTCGRLLYDQMTTTYGGCQRAIVPCPRHDHDGWMNQAKPSRQALTPNSNGDEAPNFM